MKREGTNPGMKKRLILLAVLCLAILLCACGSRDNADASGSDTAQTGTEQTGTENDEESETQSTGSEENEAQESEEEYVEEPIVVPEPEPRPELVLSTDTTVFQLASKDTQATLELREGVPYITSLKTESGTQKVGEPIAYALPSRQQVNKEYIAFQWQYQGYAPYSDEEGAVGYTLSFKEASQEIYYYLYAVARPDMAGPFEFWGDIYNETDTELVYLPDDYFSMAVKGDTAPTAWKFNKESGTAEGYSTKSGLSNPGGTGIYNVVMENSEKISASANMNNTHNGNGSIPMLYLDYGVDGIYFAQEWTHGKLTARGRGNGVVDLTACLADGGFKTRIPVGHSVYMPSIYLGVYDGDVDMGSNVFKHWFMAYKAPDNLLEDPSEPLIQQDMQLGISVAQYGIDTIKWDYGWWGEKVHPAGLACYNEGSTQVRNPDYLNVLASVGAANLPEFSAKAKEAGLDMTVYFLLKDTGLDEPGVPTSAGKYGHSEWFSNTRIVWGASADLGNAECTEFYKRYMYDFFSETGVTTWRSDFEPICHNSDKNNRHYPSGTDVTYWCTIGFRDLVDYLTDNLEDFRYESCGSGGSMKDFFTMTKATVINCDDSADFASLHASFYDSSYCIPAAQIQLPCNALTFTPDSQYYVGYGDYEYGFRATLTGAVMLSNWTGTTEEDITYWEKYLQDIYAAKMRPLIKYGDLYHILPRPDGVHWDGLQYIDVDAQQEAKGLVMLWKPTDTEGPQKTVKLRGLLEDTMYDLTFEDRPEQNCTKSGKELMEQGLTVTIEGEFGSEMIWISEAK